MKSFVSAISRRRALRILAAGAGFSLVRSPVRAATPASAFAWEGAALGAKAAINLRHADRAVAMRAIGICVAEIDRLENEFSLFRPDSALSRLNREGRLECPSLDMRRLLMQAQHYGALSGGAFDVTVQPLWQLYARHFSRTSDATSAPPRREIDRERARVDFRLLDIAAAGIAFAREGMAVTLNGIAQGYITDSLVAILRNEGFEQALVDAGELRALSGSTWSIALDHPTQAPAAITLQDCAVATSSGDRARFTFDGEFHHIVDPRSARCPDVRRGVSVIAASASAADALSTALCVLPRERHASLLRTADAVCAYVSGPDGPAARIAPAD